jgi:hypothetical protein
MTQLLHSGKSFRKTCLVTGNRVNIQRIGLPVAKASVPVKLGANVPAHGKTNARRRRSANLLYQAVITTAAAHSALGA